MNIRTTPYLTFVQFVKPTAVSMAYIKRKYGALPYGERLPDIAYKGFLLSQVSGKPKSRVLIYDIEVRDLTVTIADWSWMRIVQGEDIHTLMTSSEVVERHFGRLVYEQYFLERQNV